MKPIKRIEWKIASPYLCILWCIGITYDGGWMEALGWTSIVGGYDIIAFLLNLYIRTEKCKPSSK